MTARMNEFDATMVAATYAEAGEHEYARQLLHEERPEARKRVGRLQRVFAAIAFAEAGEPETAREIMQEEERPVARVQPRQELRA